MAKIINRCAACACILIRKTVYSFTHEKSATYGNTLDLLEQKKVIDGQ